MIILDSRMYIFATTILHFHQNDIDCEDFIIKTYFETWTNVVKEHMIVTKKQHVITQWEDTIVLVIKDTKEVVSRVQVYVAHIFPT